MHKRHLHKHHEEHGEGAKQFFQKVGKVFKPIVKSIAPLAIDLAKPLVTGAISAFQPELAIPGAIAVNALGNSANNAIKGWGIRLTHHQVHRLRHGGEITITHKSFLPSRPTHSLTLHPERLEKLKSMLQEGHPKITMQLKHGEGVWDWVKKSAKSVGKALAPHAINLAKKGFTDYYGDEYSGVANALGDVAQTGINGMGIRSHRKHLRHVGGGVPLVKFSSNGSIPSTQFQIPKYVPVYGGKINTHSGLNSHGNLIMYPIQLGSPYAKMDSQAMHPFLATHSQLSGYNPINKPPIHGGSFVPSGGHGGGIYPSGYRS